MPSAVPHLVINGAEKAIAFYEKAFGASLGMKLPGEDGKLMHAALDICGGAVYLVDDFGPAYMHEAGARAPDALGGSSIVVHLEAPDTDAACAKAVKAGANVLIPPEDMFWGDRYRKVRDPFGHVWSMSAPTKK